MQKQTSFMLFIGFPEESPKHYIIIILVKKMFKRKQNQLLHLVKWYATNIFGVNPTFMHDHKGDKCKLDKGILCLQDALQTNASYLLCSNKHKLSKNILYRKTSSTASHKNTFQRKLKQKEFFFQRDELNLCITLFYHMYYLFLR